MKRNRVLVLTTHFMDEAEMLGDHVIVVSKGHLRVRGAAGKGLCTTGRWWRWSHHVCPPGARFGVGLEGAVGYRLSAVLVAALAERRDGHGPVAGCDTIASHVCL